MTTTTIINGKEFNKVNPITEARQGWWMDERLKMVIFYYEDGDSQVFAKWTTERTKQKRIADLFNCGTFN